jgi:hypothetical protein
MTDLSPAKVLGDARAISEVLRVRLLDFERMSAAQEEVLAVAKRADASPKEVCAAAERAGMVDSYMRGAAAVTVAVAVAVDSFRATSSLITGKKR